MIGEFFGPTFSWWELPIAAHLYRNDLDSLTSYHVVAIPTRRSVYRILYKGPGLRNVIMAMSTSTRVVGTIDKFHLNQSMTGPIATKHLH
jgi:hypothetical protein